MATVTKEKLKVLRARLDMSQEDLAKKAGLSTRSIGLYEADVRNLRNAKYPTLENIAKALGVSVDDIFLG